jgi:hypothetical protein
MVEAMASRPPRLRCPRSASFWAGCWLAAGWLLAGCWLAAGWLLAGWLLGYGKA